MLITVEGHRVHFDLLGRDGDPVVLLVHALAADTGMWSDQVVALLAAGRRVLRIDLRGHGGSDPLDGEYTMDELADDIRAILLSLGTNQVDYVGLSLGGMCGQAFALRHGEFLRSLVVCDALPESLPNAREVWAPRVAKVMKAGSVEPIARETVDRWLTATFRERYPSRYQQIVDTCAATTVKGYTGCVAAIQSFSFVDRLGSLSLPVLVLSGSDDPGVPPEEGRRLASLIPGARYVSIPSAKHLPNVEFPDLFNRTLLDWLGTAAA